MPKIVGNKGYVLEKKNTEALSTIIHNAINNDDLLRLGLEASEIIKTNYTLSKRNLELLQIITSLIK
jgi:hypothetical protein